MTRLRLSRRVWLNCCRLRRCASNLPVVSQHAQEACRSVYLMSHEFYHNNSRKCRLLGIPSDVIGQLGHSQESQVQSVFRMAYKPPLSRAGTVTRTEAGYHVTDGNIAAIDFGTTSVSIAFITKGDKKVSNLTLDIEDQSIRVPNAVILKKEDGKMKVEAFGSLARKKFISVRSSERNKYIYFERIKMLMRREGVNFHIF